MGILIGTSGIILGFAPSIIGFLMFLQEPEHLLIAIATAFFYLISVLISSIFFFSESSFRIASVKIIYSVLFQELFRFLFLKLLNNSKNLSSDSKHTNVLASGFGFGIASGLIQYSVILKDSFSPAIITCNSCEWLDLFIVAAFTTLLFISLHIAWHVLAFKCFSSNKFNFFYSLVVVVLHFIASFSVITN